MKKDKNIDKLFRDKLLDYEQQPPAWLLENVLAGVAGAKRKRKIVFWRAAGVAAALLLAFVAGWQVNYMNQKNLTPTVVESKKSAQGTNETTNALPDKEIVQSKTQDVQSTRIPRFATAEDSSKVTNSDQSGKNDQLATRVSHPDKNTLTALSVNPHRDDFILLHSLKAINRVVGPKDQIANVLHEKKANRSAIEPQELTIDQQIMEQNQQQLRVQNEKRKNAHWLVGAQVSPAYSVNRSSHSAQYASNMLIYSSNTPVELGGGLSVEVRRGKRWSLQSGVYYSGVGQSSSNQPPATRQISGYYASATSSNGAEYFNAQVNIEDSKMMINSQAGVIELKTIPTGMELGTNLEDKTMASAVVISDARFIQNFQYLEIPLYLRYTLIDTRFDVDLMGGVSSNVLVGNQTYMESNTGKSLVGKTQDMQEMNYSGTFGLGLKYGVSKRIYLNLEPRIKYYLHSLNSNSAVTYKPYTIGVYTGISYQF